MDRDVFAVLVEQAVDLLRRATACGGSDATDAQLRERVGMAVQAKGVLDTMFFRTLRDVAARPEVVAGAGGDGARAARVLLVHAHRVDPREAGRDVAAAVALDPDATGLPRLAAAFAAGAVTRGHVDAAVCGVGRLASWVASHVMADGTAAMDAIDARLTEHATAMPPVAVKQVAAMLREEVNAVTGVQFRAVIEAAARHRAVDSMTGTGVRQDGEPAAVTDHRSLAQRQADAIAMLVLGRIPSVPSVPGAPSVPSCRTTPQEPVEVSVSIVPQLLVHATADQVAAVAGPALLGNAGAAVGLARVEPGGRTDTGGAFVDAAAFANLACLGVLRRVLTAPNGADLGLGRGYRLATPAQRAAICARGGGCVIPICTVPVSQCDIHHDRHQRLQRTTTHEITPAAAALGQQLRLDHDQRLKGIRCRENDDTG